MAAIVRRFAKWASWLLPHGVLVARRAWMSRATSNGPALVSADVLSGNRLLQGRHAGERCFILGNGPSVKGVNLLALRGETVISVSNGYLHKDYAAIAPRYHCLPQVASSVMTKADLVAWFNEMHERLGDAELFLNETEAAVVRDHELFKGRKVHYLALRDNFDDWPSREIVDISNPVPGVESVPIMAIMIAMYLGFTNIHLLGVDHSHFKSGEYVYAFNLGVQANKDAAVGADGQVVISRHDDFQSLARLWRQYRVLREIAESNEVEITNATPGGELDEFLRLDFGTLMGEK